MSAGAATIRRMIQDLLTAAAHGDYDAIGELEKVAAAGPDRLAPHLHQLLDLGILWPPTLFRAADSGVVQRVIDRVDCGRHDADLNRLLLVLAHTRDPLAEAAFRRWSAVPPPGTDKLHVGPLEYAKQGAASVASTRPCSRAGGNPHHRKSLT